MVVPARMSQLAKTLSGRALARRLTSTKLSSLHASNMLLFQPEHRHFPLQKIEDSTLLSCCPACSGKQAHAGQPRVLVMPYAYWCPGLQALKQALMAGTLVTAGADSSDSMQAACRCTPAEIVLQSPPTTVSSSSVPQGPHIYVMGFFVCHVCGMLGQQPCTSLPSCMHLCLMIRYMRSTQHGLSRCVLRS